MSTRNTIRREVSEDCGYHIFTDVMDDDPAPIHLSLIGFEFEADNYHDGHVEIVIPQEWARKLGLVP